MDDLRVDGKWKLEEIIIKTATVFSFPSMFFEQMNDIESVVRGFFTKWGWYCSIFPLFVQEELFRFHVQWKELIDSLFDRF